jgi:7-cyano-7-deazaguanine synthase
LADKYGCAHQIVDLSGYGELVPSALTRKHIHPMMDGGLGGLPSTFTPGRNMLFLTVAASYALAHEIKHIVAGVCQTDYSGYPDCRRIFIDAFEHCFLLATGRVVKVHTPLMFLTKAQTWELAGKLHIVPEIITQTMTCYHGNDHMNEWGYGCGECPACNIRRRGYIDWTVNEKE